MFISKSMRIFALSILLVPVAQPAMALSPRMENAIGNTVVSAYLAGVWTLLINTSRSTTPSQISFMPAGLAALAAGLMTALFEYVNYKQEAKKEYAEKLNRVNKDREYASKSLERVMQVRKEQELYTKRQGRQAAHHAAEYARLRARAQQSAQKAAKAAQDALPYNASIESRHAQRLLS